MVAAPLFVVVLLVTALLLKTKSANGGSVTLGLLLGLTLASTPWGPPVLSAVTAMSSGLMQGLSSIGGQ